jgi:hypothetical protein
VSFGSTGRRTPRARSRTRAPPRGQRGGEAAELAVQREAADVEDLSRRVRVRPAVAVDVEELVAAPAAPDPDVVGVQRDQLDHLAPAARPRADRLQREAVAARLRPCRHIAEPVERRVVDRRARLEKVRLPVVLGRLDLLLELRRRVLPVEAEPIPAIVSAFSRTARIAAGSAAASTTTRASRPPSRTPARHASTAPGSRKTRTRQRTSAGPSRQRGYVRSSSASGGSRRYETTCRKRTLSAGTSSAPSSCTVVSASCRMYGAKST